MIEMTPSPYSGWWESFVAPQLRSGGTVERAWDIGKPGSQDTLKSYWKDEGGRERQVRAVRAYIIQYIGLFVEADADTLETFR